MFDLEAKGVFENAEVRYLTQLLTNLYVAPLFFASRSLICAFLNGSFTLSAKKRNYSSALIQKRLASIFKWSRKINGFASTIQFKSVIQRKRGV